MSIIYLLKLYAQSECKVNLKKREEASQSKVKQKKWKSWFVPREKFTPKSPIMQTVAWKNYQQNEEYQVIFMTLEKHMPL